MTEAGKIDLTNVSAKFRPVAEDILPPLANLLEELYRLENDYFIQSKRLYRKGRVISFHEGIREEITNDEDLKAKFKMLYRQLLDSHYTPKFLTQQRDCIHGTHYPADFKCLHTGCTIVLTMKSAGKATIDLLPNHGSIPYDMSDSDVRFMLEKATTKPPYFYEYLLKYRFTIKIDEDRWKIDAVHNAGLNDTRWRRDYYF